MNSKQFKEMCIRIGYVDSNLKVDYDRVFNLMMLGQLHMLVDCEYELYPSLHCSLRKDYETMNEYRKEK